MTHILQILIKLSKFIQINYKSYRKLEKLFFLGMFRSGIGGTGVCWIGALGLGNSRHKSGGSVKVARPIDLAKPIKHGMVALHNVAIHY